jgi:hypothetical protein
VPAQLLTANPKGGHPAWHFAAVAAAAVGVFLAIKVVEWWGHRRAEDDPSRTRRPVARPGAPTVALALASLGSSAIHAAVCPSHFREATAFGVFFVVIAAAQAGWAIAIIVRPSRKLLVAGALGNAGVVAVWVLTRTVGLPLGPEIWRPEAITTADAVVTQLEVGLGLGAYWLLHGASRRCAAFPA